MGKQRHNQSEQHHTLNKSNHVKNRITETISAKTHTFCASFGVLQKVRKAKFIFHIPSIRCELFLCVRSLAAHQAGHV